MAEVGLGSVTFVGSGPGEFGLLTLLGARSLRFADLVVIDQRVDIDEVRKLTAGHTRIELVAEDEVAQLVEAAREGLKTVRLSQDDHFCEAFTTDVVPRVRAAGVRINVIPGLNRWSTLFTYGAIATGRTTAYMHACDHAPEIEQWPTAGTVALHTSGSLLGEIGRVAQERYAPNDKVLLLSGVGSTAQTSRMLTWADLAPIDEGEYYIVYGDAIADSDRARVGWYESKPLFDWRVLSPRTKDDLGRLAEELAQYGATTETIPTMSIEPPRTEQGMERAVRGLVDGRYLWCVFTSPHAVAAVAERLAEYGLDSRALSGISIAAVGRGTAGELRKLGIVADLEPSGPNTVGALATEFPAFDNMMDPMNRVLVPSADVSIEPLMEGLGHLGWEVEGVTAYRTVRAAPPPAETREAIKGGMFDAVVFTSATAVRNMIGIAGKPHAVSIIAAIGEATAAACEQHGLRVDVIAKSPTFASLAEGLAQFADERRAAALAKGEPLKKPSERKRRRRRKTVAEAT